MKCVQDFPNSPIIYGYKAASHRTLVRLHFQLRDWRSLYPIRAWMDDKKKLKQCEKWKKKAGSSQARLNGKILRINGYLTYPSLTPTLSNCFGWLQGCITTEKKQQQHRWGNTTSMASCFVLSFFLIAVTTLIFTKLRLSSLSVPSKSYWSQNWHNYKKEIKCYCCTQILSL